MHLSIVAAKAARYNERVSHAATRQREMTMQAQHLLAKKDVLEWERLEALRKGLAAKRAAKRDHRERVASKSRKTAVRQVLLTPRILESYRPPPVMVPDVNKEEEADDYDSGDDSDGDDGEESESDADASSELSVTSSSEEEESERRPRWPVNGARCLDDDESEEEGSEEEGSEEEGSEEEGSESGSEEGSSYDETDIELSSSVSSSPASGPADATFNIRVDTPYRNQRPPTIEYLALTTRGGMAGAEATRRALQSIENILGCERAGLTAFEA